MLAFLARLAKQGGLAVADALGRLLLSLLLVLTAIGLMVIAVTQFGVTGLLVVAVPLIGGLAAWAFMHAGGEGSSDDGD